MLRKIKKKGNRKAKQTLSVTNKAEQLNKNRKKRSKNNR